MEFLVHSYIPHGIAGFFLLPSSAEADTLKESVVISHVHEA